MPLWGELKRRDVFKVAAAYLVASWLIVQVVGVLTEPLSLPDALDTVVVVLLAIGFPFAVIIAWVYEVTPEGIKVTPTGVDDSKSAPRRPSRRLTYVVIGLLMTAVGLTWLGNYVLAPSSTEFGTGSRIAILPCDDLSPDPTNSFFAVGIHEELLNRLSSLSGLNVISRTSVRSYAGRRPPIPEIAAELNADAIIECSARYAGDRVMLTTQLIDGASDTHLWADAFTGDMSNPESVFEIQADIATSVADALHVEFFRTELEQIERVPTEDPDAYDAYLRGRAYQAQARPADAVEAFRQAVDIDTEFGEAWLGLAQAYELLQVYQTSEEFQGLQADAVDKALEILPASWAAYAWRANQLMAERDWIGAASSMQVAIGLSPPVNSSWAETYGGNYLAQLGRVEEATNVYVEARASDVLSPLYSGQTAWVLDLAGRNAEALAEFERSRELNGGEVLFIVQHLHALLVSGDTARIDAFLSEPAVATESVMGRLADVWPSPQATTAVLRAILEDPSELQRVALLPGWSVIAAYHGDLDLALEFLREAYLRRDGDILAYMWHPLMSELRTTSAFKELVVGLGLDDYWRAYEWPDACRPVGEDDFECF
jgi:adenylate cyclase